MTRGARPLVLVRIARANVERAPGAPRTTTHSTETLTRVESSLDYVFRVPRVAGRARIKTRVFEITIRKADYLMYKEGPGDKEE